MSCAGYFERLRRKEEAQEQIMKQQVLHEIDIKKETLQRRLQSLQVQGDFHMANQVKARLAQLEVVAERMKQLLET